MSSMLVQIYLLAMFSASVQGMWKCFGPNEEFKPCGPTCPDVCHEPAEPRRCPDLCEFGCTCKPGFKLNKQEVCVAPKDCERLAALDLD